MRDLRATVAGLLDVIVASANSTPACSATKRSVVLSGFSRLLAPGGRVLISVRDCSSVDSLRSSVHDYRERRRDVRRLRTRCRGVSKRPRLFSPRALAHGSGFAPASDQPRELRGLIAQPTRTVELLVRMLPVAKLGEERYSPARWPLEREKSQLERKLQRLEFEAKALQRRIDGQRSSWKKNFATLNSRTSCASAWLGSSTRRTEARTRSRFRLKRPDMQDTAVTWRLTPMSKSSPIPAIFSRSLGNSSWPRARSPKGELVCEHPSGEFCSHGLLRWQDG